MPAPGPVTRLLLAACCALLAAHAGADSVTWLVPEFSVTDLQAQGGPRRSLVEPMAELLARSWPELQQEVVATNVRRSLKLIGAGEPACHLSLLRTPEREQVAVLLATNLVPPVQLIVRRDKLPLLKRNAAGHVDLEALMQEPRLKGALVEGRSYGPHLDELLARRATNGLAGNISHYAASDFARVLQMLVGARADYTIDYDFVLALQRQQSERLQELVALPIQGSSEPMLSYVACPRNDWGRRILARLDRLFASPAGVAALRESTERWLTPDTRARYGERFEAFYAERLKSAGARASGPP